MAKKYFGLFTDYNSVIDAFETGRWDYDKKERGNPPVPKDFPTPADILFACYEYENYSGNAFVLFKQGKDIFEVEGSHCSCWGLEDQWKPAKTTWKALAMRKFYGLSELNALKNLINSHLPN